MGTTERTSESAPVTLPDRDAVMAGSVGSRFLETAARRGGAIALNAPSESLTYEELANRVRSGASVLTRRCPGSVTVGVLAAHDAALVSTILSVLASGNVVVVVDPVAPINEQRHVLLEGSVQVLVHDADNAARASELSGELTALTTDELASGDSTWTAPAVGPDDPAMLAFTSGTSGTPKAAIITHGVLLNLVRGASTVLGITEADRMPMLFPASLAVAAYPMFLPLLNGGTLSTLDVRSVGLAPIPEFLQQERITLAYLAPTVVRFLVDALRGREFDALRMIALGGELVDDEVLRLTEELFDPQQIAVGYGTTETGIVSLHVRAAGQEHSGPVPCGAPVDGVEISLLTEDGEPASEGESGEVAITSRHLFHGYLGHPELNRQVLSPDPAGRPGWRSYRTGDHGYFDTSGELVILGRVDTKVKVRGRFVVLGDVESDVQQIDGVVDAVVTAPHRGAFTELLCYVVLTDEAELDGQAIRGHLLAEREAYRVPTRFVVLDELPRLPNGKVDRRALPDPDSVLPLGIAESTAHRHAGSADVRGQIAEIWAGLLPVGVVGDDEDFAVLGGDSLLAAQMLVALEQRLDVRVPMGELVHARTVRELAEVVVRIRSGATKRSVVSMVQPGDPHLPRLWFVHDLQGSAYRARHLAQALGSQWPLWSFESPLLDGEPNRFTSLDTFAARYLRDLREAQPEGPYWLAGYSFGGICAYEMARQLARDDQEVAFVGVVDVGPGYRGPGWSGHRSPLRPWFGVPKPPPEGTGPTEALRYYGEMFRENPTGAARHAMVRSGIARLVDPIRFRRDLHQHGRVRPEWRLWYAWEQHWRLAAGAWDRRNAYEGVVDLFWADATASADATMGWGALVDDLHIHRFPGDHEGILEPRGADALADVLREALTGRLDATDAAVADGPSVST